MSQNHVRFLAKTVLVKNNNVEPACRILDRILRNERFYEDVRRRIYYEKPTQKRQRLSYERCSRIYNTDMQRKIAFIMRKNRVDPWPR
ncbi:28S ribosomal protein S21, mitochondrial-like [Gigantopelta aegis]|uniref:28S ribosomal protein S21, mitochondrial-like n=1 Tax=Gigantopelta aegis TaxID=1735272 RepID=UPI001B88C1DD|nr:28S ribosomal protein S21, mitochondrial-like [Gigantopelta aegis]